MPKPEPRPLVVFVAHHMSDDPEGNMAKVVAICRRIHSTEVIPIFPSALTRKYLTASARDKELAARTNEVLFASGGIDQLWLYGDRMSAGIEAEIALANKYGVKVVPMSRYMQAICGGTGRRPTHRSRSRLK